MQVDQRYQFGVRPGVRRVRRTIRRIDSWSVLKFSAAFYGSVMLIFLFAGAILYYAAATTDIIDKIENFVQGIGWPDFEIRPIQLFRIWFLLGLIQVVIWTTVSVFVAFLYNLVADVVGGIEVTMSERDF